MRVFKFYARKNAKFFAKDATCYIMMHSDLGCVMKITGSSNKVQNLSVPEKFKTFNRSLTKAEIAAEENEVRRKELYVQRLEEKY